MTKAEKQKECHTYLEYHRIKDRQYTAGLFQSGITIYKQQVRALNIFYALHELQKINRKSTICIIGGGVAGVTLAGAALKKGLKVTLIEREPILLHLQHGCDTRHIHPHLYKWPESGSQFPYARLPILSWKTNTASNVAKQILSQFNAIEDEYKRNYTLLKNIKSTNCTGEVDEKLLILASAAKSSRKYLVQADVIVYCTGFGIEKACQGNVTPSYWRNDDYGQTIVHNRRNTFISGVGDGALMDLFRIKIIGFNYDSFLMKYYSVSGHAHLTKTLLSIKQGWTTHRSPNTLYEQLEELKSFRGITELKDYLKEQRHPNINVVLNGDKSLLEVFNLDKISFINCFLFYLLTSINSKKSNKIYSYWQGEVRKVVAGYRFLPADGDKKKSLDNRRLIIRHGTSRKNAFKHTNVSDTEIKLLEAKQGSIGFNSEDQLWTYTSFSKIMSGSSKIAFHTYETISICSNLVSILSRIIQERFPKLEFKVTLYRLIELGQALRLQTVSPYFGSTPSDGNVGRVIELEKGNLGLTCLSGETISLTASSNMINIRKKLKLRENEVFSKSRSFLTIPIFAKAEDGHKVPNLVLWFDAKPQGFFDDRFVGLVVSAIRGWINAVDNAVRKKYVYMDDWILDPITLETIRMENADFVSNLAEIKNGPNFVKLSSETMKNVGNLFFEKYYSFDIFHNFNPEPYNLSYLNSKEIITYDRHSKKG